jgi:PIN domain nuclease of toxin-antitoxin system
VKLLLDTQIALWATLGTLPAKARQLIKDADAVYVSAVSPWEISIKAALGRIGVEPTDLLNGFETANFLELPMTWRHAVTLRKLTLRDHRDPFDRMLVAQAMTEPLRLVTTDRALTAYSELVLLI